MLCSELILCLEYHLIFFLLIFLVLPNRALLPHIHSLIRKVMQVHEKWIKHDFDNVQLYLAINHLSYIILAKIYLLVHDM